MKRILAVIIAALLLAWGPTLVILATEGSRGAGESGIEVTASAAQQIDAREPAPVFEAAVNQVPEPEPVFDRSLGDCGQVNIPQISIPLSLLALAFVGIPLVRRRK